MLLLFVIVIAPDIVLVRMTSTSCRSCKDAGEKDEDGGEDAAGDAHGDEDGMGTGTGMRPHEVGGEDGEGDVDDRWGGGG